MLRMTAGSIGNTPSEFSPRAILMNGCDKDGKARAAFLRLCEGGSEESEWTFYLSQRTSKSTCVASGATPVRPAQKLRCRFPCASQSNFLGSDGLLKCWLKL